jgi:hypothetical protein
VRREFAGHAYSQLAHADRDLVVIRIDLVEVLARIDDQDTERSEVDARAFPDIGCLRVEFRLEAEFESDLSTRIPTAGHLVPAIGNNDRVRGSDPA